MFFRRKLLPFSRFIVHDRSMMPFYKPGDHVLVFGWGKIAIGDVIVFQYRGKNYIKRIKKISGKIVTACADNLQKSSASYEIETSSIYGKVFKKY